MLYEVSHRRWALTTTLTTSTLLKNTLSKVSFSNPITNDFWTILRLLRIIFVFYTFKNYTFESVVVGAHAHSAKYTVFGCI